MITTLEQKMTQDLEHAPEISYRIDQVGRFVEIRFMGPLRSLILTPDQARNLISALSKYASKISPVTHLHYTSYSTRCGVRVAPGRSITSDPDKITCRTCLYCLKKDREKRILEAVNDNHS